MTELRTASFKGIEFPVISFKLRRGQRFEVYEYPGIDISLANYFGREKRTWTIEGVFLGQDYLQKVNEIISAAEEPSPGELILPNGQRIIAAVEPIEINVSALYEVRFTLIAYEVGVSIPQPTISPVDAVAEATDRADAVEANNFAGIFKRTRDWFNKAMQNLTEIENFLRTTLPLKEIELVISDLQELKATLWSVAQSAPYLFDRMKNIVSQIEDLFALSYLMDYFKKEFINSRFLFSTGFANTNNDTAQSVMAFSRAQYTLAVTAQMNTAAKAQIRSYDDANNILKNIRTHVDILEHDNSAMTDAMSVLTDVILMKTLKIPRLKDYYVDDTTPAKVLAYDIYQDISRADEIVARNDIFHPGFIIAGTTLKILER